MFAIIKAHNCVNMHGSVMGRSYLQLGSELSYLSLIMV